MLDTAFLRVLIVLSIEIFFVKAIKNLIFQSGFNLPFHIAILVLYSVG